MLKQIIVLLLTVWLGACANTGDQARPPGTERCESFFIYVLCISDLDSDGQVDYMYFDDTREIFMYAESMLSALANVLPLHACAIPLSDNTRKYSSQLLYNDALGISARLATKAKLAASYRAAQPAVDACNTSANPSSSRDHPDNRPFDDNDNWLEDEQ